MKASAFKAIVCFFAVSVAFSSCKSTGGSSDADKALVMFDKVVSYKQSVSWQYNEYGRNGFTTDKTVLDSLFPNIFENEDPQCNYFAVYYMISSGFANYMIISQDTVLYDIRSKEGCAIPDVIAYNVMLVCSDAEGAIRKKIDFADMQNYVDPDWDCNKDSIFF